MGNVYTNSGFYQDRILSWHICVNSVLFLEKVRVNIPKTIKEERLKDITNVSHLFQTGLKDSQIIQNIVS